MRHIAILVTSLACVSCQTTADQPSLMQSGASASLKVGEHDVEITTTATAGRIRVSINKAQKSVEFDLPNAKDPVSRIAATRWCRLGIAMAVETEAADGSRRSYYWATLNKKGIDKDLDPPAVDPIMVNTSEDLYLSQITNPAGDTIHVTIMGRHAGAGRLNDEREGYLYVHRCPVEAGYRGPDRLYELRPVKLESPK